MRVRYWISLWLCSALGTVQALGVIYNYSIYNGGSQACNASIEQWYQGAYDSGIGGPFNVGPGSTYNGSANMSGSTVQVTWKCRWQPGAGPTNGAPTDDITFTMVTSGTYNVGTFHIGGGQPSTNYYCVYHVVWTNTGPTWAAPNMVIVYENGPWAGTVLSPTNFQGTVLSPGSGVSFYHTNWIGTNASVGCGTLGYGDSRANATVPDYLTSGDMYGVSVPGGSPGGTQGSGNQAGSGGDQIGINTNAPGGKAGGTTNLATQKDIFILANANAAGLAAVERSVSGVGTNIQAMANLMNTNFSLLSTDLKGVGTNVNVSGSNTVNALNASSSNIVAAIGTNTAARGTNASGNGTNDFGGIAGELTNIFNFMSNRVAEEKSFGQSWISNSLYSASNYTSWASNWMGDIGAGISNVNTIGQQGAGTAFDTLSGMGSGEEPDTEWGVLVLPGLGSLVGGPPPPPGAQEGWRIDFKPALRLQPIEDRCPGFRFWLRSIILWGAIAFMIIHFSDELRRAYRDMFGVMESPGKILREAAGVAGLAVGGPAGAVLAEGAAATINLPKLIWLAAVLVFVPSICVGAAATFYAAAGASPTTFISSAVAVVTGPNGAFHSLGYFIALVTVWCPVIELGLLGLNYMIARLAMNAFVTWSMAFVKVETNV